MIAVFVLSGTINSGTPPVASSARTWASIPSGSVCVPLAKAKVKLDAPSAATKIRALRNSPVCLPHRRRQLLLEPAIEFAKPGVAVTAGLGCDIFVPDDLQRDVLAFQLAMRRRPIRLRVQPMSPLASAVRIKRRLQFGVADAFPKRSKKARRAPGA